MDTTKQAIQTVLTSPEYDDVRTDHILLNNLQYVSLAGSHAYGTATPDSDIDVRGWYFSSISDLLGLDGSKEGQMVFPATDTVFYSFHKIIRLLSKCNPNIIELLGVKPEHIIYCSPLAKMVMKESEMFLSKLAFVTFAGYATQQLRRLENALAMDHYPQEEKEEHILRSLEAESLASTDAYALFNRDNYMRLYLADSDKEGYDQEIHIDLNLKHVPLRDFVTLRNQFSNQLKNYGKIRHRNNKKDDDHLYKHAMHLIRLYYMGIDILREHRVVTYREKEHDLLMSIRNQEVPLSKVFEMQAKLEVELQKARDESTLPDQPDWYSIDAFTINLLQKYISGDYDYCIDCIDWGQLKEEMENGVSN